MCTAAPGNWESPTPNSPGCFGKWNFRVEEPPPGSLPRDGDVDIPGEMLTIIWGVGSPGQHWSSDIPGMLASAGAKLPWILQSLLMALWGSRGAGLDQSSPNPAGFLGDAGLEAGRAA